MSQSGYLFEKSGAWYVRYREQGKQPCHRLGTKRDYPTKTEARDAMNDFMRDINRTVDIPGAAATVGEFVENTYWKSLEKRLDKSSIEGYKKCWNKHLSHRISAKRIRNCRPVDIQAVMNAIGDEYGMTRTHTTYKWIKTTLSAIFSEAVRCGIIDRNPVREVRVPKGKKKGRKTHACSLSEIRSHFQAFAGDTPIIVVDEDGTEHKSHITRKMVRALIGVAAYAGFRQGEIRGLWREDDLGDHLLVRRVVSHNEIKDHTKTGEDDVEPGMVPVIPQLRMLLDAIKPEHGFFFVGDRNAVLDLENLSDRVMRPVLRAHGLNWHGWHAYRRGLASNLKQLGVDDLTIQAILRHSDVRTTQRHYIKTVPEQVKAGMQKLAENLNIQ